MPPVAPLVPLRIYVAGKIVDTTIEKTLANIQRGKALTEQLLMLGCAPFPTFYTSEWERTVGFQRTDFYRVDNAWIKRGIIDCVVVVLEGFETSEGVSGEIALATSEGIPVCYGIEDFKYWRTWRAAQMPDECANARQTPIGGM